MRSDSATPKRGNQLLGDLVSQVRAVVARSAPQRVLGNIGWLVSEKVLRLLVGLFVGVWMARYLGPEKFGILSYAVALAMMFGNVAGLGLDSIVVRDVVRDAHRRDTTLGTSFVLKGVAGIAAGLLVVGMVAILRREDAVVRTAVAIMAAALAFKSFDVIGFWFESQVRSKYEVCARSGAFLVIACVKVILIVTRRPVLWFVWATMAEIVVGALFLFTAYRAAGEHVSRWRVSWVRGKQLLGSSWPLILSTAAIMVYMRSDTIMLGSMATDHAVGVYNAAVRISELWYFVPVAVVASMFPSLLQAKGANDPAYESGFTWLYDIMVWFGLGVGILVTLFASPIVHILYGDSYMDAAGVLTIHIWAAVFVFLGVASERWLLAENLVRLTLLRGVLGAGANVGLNFVLIPRYGVMGAATATLISQAVACYFFDILLPSTRTMWWAKTRSLFLVSSMVRARALTQGVLGFLRARRERR